MSFRPYQFGTVTLPGYAYKVSGAPGTLPGTVRTVGGFYDSHGTEQADIDLPYTLTYSCLAYETLGIATLGSTLQALRAMRGKKDRLWIDPWDTADADRWAWARCISVPMEATVYNRKTQPLDVQFQILSRWHGTGHGGDWDLDAGYLFDSGLYFDNTGASTLDEGPPEVVTLNNGGDLRVDDCGITVTATSAAITYLKITGYDQSTPAVAQTEFEFTGTIGVGKSLVIDCGDWTVLNDGVDAYGDFALTANHIIAPWLRLNPGNNTVDVTYVCADAASTITFTYADGYA